MDKKSVYDARLRLMNAVGDMYSAVEYLSISGAEDLERELRQLLGRTNSLCAAMQMITKAPGPTREYPSVPTSVVVPE